MEKPTFFARRSLVILMVVFFLVPFALRGARMAVQGSKNDVKDWLPKDFEETQDLDEFRKHFLSEQFVLVSWEGCKGDENDQRFKLFVAKLMPETPPTQLPPAASDDAASDTVAAIDATTPEQDAASAGAPETEAGQISSPTQYIHRDDDFIGDRLGLYSTGDFHENWGARNEKWLKGLKLDRPDSNDECWYYITPEGDLYRWSGVDAPVASLARLVYRATVDKTVEGTLVHSFGPVDGPWYHKDPRRLRAQLFKTVTTGPDVLKSLTREGGELESDPEEAQERLAGTLFGPDGKTTAIMVTLTDAARRNLHLVLGRGFLGKPRGRLYEVALESNIAPEALRMGGPPVDNVAIDEEGTITLVRLIGLCGILGLGLSFACFRSITATIMIFFVGGISAVLSLAFVWWMGSSVDAIMMSMPALVYVLGLSGAAHIMNYYHEAVDEHGHIGAPERAIGHGWKPAVLCSVTTAIGLVSLVTSELIPIQKFGVFSAIGVMATLLILFTYLPSALQIWPQKARIKPAGRANDQPWLDRHLSGFWNTVGSFIIRHHAAVAIGCVLIIGAVGYGVTRINTTVNLLKMFHSEAKIIKDYEWLEANLGQLVPMEVVIRIPKQDQCPSTPELRRLQDELESAETSPPRKEEIAKILHEAQFQLPFLERMEMAARVQNVIEDEFGSEKRDIVGKALSAATFVRPLPKPGGSTSARLTRSSTSGRLEAHRDEFLHSDYLRIDENQTELWRVSLRLGATKGLDYGAFVSTLQETVEPVLAAQRERENILRQLEKAHEAANRSLANSRVLLLGVPAGAFASADDDPAEAPAAAGQKAKKPTADPVEQNKIFARTLRDLLINSRLRLAIHSPGEGALPENFDELLKGHDCVVLVGDASAYDMGRIKKHARLLIDARDHAFHPSAGERTAYQQNPKDVSAVYTGVVPIVYKAQRSLLNSLISSTFWSFITITPLMMFISRSIAGGAVSMLPNVLPVLMVFGGMGWLNIDVDVGSMMTASIALGVAVDDTIHYLNWFREELDRLGDRKKAILAAYKHCATPTLQAATISGLGLSIFALSTFTPTQRFGYLMLTILWMGAIAELIFFPAILAGPLGAVFQPRKKAAPAGETHATTPPQLQVIRDDEASLHDAPTGNGDGHATPVPHGGKGFARGSVRQDPSHRSRS